MGDGRCSLVGCQHPGPLLGGKGGDICRVSGPGDGCHGVERDAADDAPAQGVGVETVEGNGSDTGPGHRQNDNGDGLWDKEHRQEPQADGGEAEGALLARSLGEEDGERWENGKREDVVGQPESGDEPAVDGPDEEQFDRPWSSFRPATLSTLVPRWIFGANLA